jgi:hypothetical protein
LQTIIPRLKRWPVRGLQKCPALKRIAIRDAFSER